MAGMATSTAAVQVRDALLAAAVTVFADPAVLVCVGHPGMDMPDDVVSFAAMRTTQVPATLGTNRSRQEEIVLEVMFSIWRNGGADQETVTNDRAYALLALLETYCRRADPTLGGVALWCFLTATASEGATAPQTLAQGRCTELLATFTAAVRITA